MASIALRNLSVNYTTQKQKPVLEIDILEIPQGRVVGIYGRNHVGKSTLLKTLTQTAKGVEVKYKHGGAILYDGKAYDFPKREPYISYVPQRYAETLFPWYSIEKNLRLPLIAEGADVEAIETTVNKLCGDFGFVNQQELFHHFGFLNENQSGSNKSKATFSLSGGQQQTLVLLRSLVRIPSVLIMDEPFSALDIYKGAKLRKNIQKFIENHNVTTVFVSHDLEETVALADQIVFLERDLNTSVSRIVGLENVGEMRQRSNFNENEMKIFVKSLKARYNVG